MTKKKFPCPECNAQGYEPHKLDCSIGKARSKAARKGRKPAAKPNRAKRNTARRQLPVTVGAGAGFDMAATKLVNRVAIVVDRSISTRLIHGDIINALNDQINTLKTEASQHGQETYLSVYDFGNDVRCLFKDQYIHSVQPIQHHQIQVHGLTAMFDAHGRAAADLEALPDANQDNVSFLVITITDGQENRSRNYSQYDFTANMQRLNGTDRWTFVFNGPPQSRGYLEAFGVHPGNIQEWEGTVTGVQNMTVNTSIGTQSYFTSRGQGQRSTDKFFVNLSDVDDSDIQRMTDISHQFRIFQVDNADPDGREWQIRNFVEDRMNRRRSRRDSHHFYKIGSAFYELTKPEKIQAAKDILVMDSNGRIYGGYEARDLIGIPRDRDVRVTPENVGAYRIFVNSTSVNRKLVRGTRLLVRRSML
jgi:hypothetical protein